MLEGKTHPKVEFQKTELDILNQSTDGKHYLKAR